MGAEHNEMESYLFKGLKRRDIFAPGGIQWLRFELEELLAFTAIAGLLMHSVGLYIYVTFFTESAFASWSYPLRILDPFWWILWWLGSLLLLKSGIFNYPHYIFLVILGFLFGFVSFIITGVHGLGLGVYPLALAFASGGLSIFLNKRKQKTEEQ